MRICGGLQAFHLWSQIGTPNSRKAQEEALLRSKPIDLGNLLSHKELLQSHVGQMQAAVIGDVLALGEFAVLLHLAVGYKVAVLVFNALGMSVVRGAIFLTPPVGEVARTIELAALIVESVSQLVHHPGRPDRKAAAGFPPGS